MFLYIEVGPGLSMGNDENDPKLRVDQQELESFAFEILTAAGVTKHHAQTVADALDSKSTYANSRTAGLIRTLTFG